MRFRRLQHVSLAYTPGAQDKVRAFYGAGVGLREIAAPATLEAQSVVWFAAGADELEMNFFPGTVEAEHRGHVCLEVDDVDAARRQLEAGGFKPYDATMIPNRPRFFCRDPFGNLLEFTTIRGAFR